MIKKKKKEKAKKERKRAKNNIWWFILSTKKKNLKIREVAIGHETWGVSFKSCPVAMEINSATNSPIKQLVPSMCAEIHYPRKYFVVWIRPSFTINNCTIVFSVFVYVLTNKFCQLTKEKQLQKEVDCKIVLIAIHTMKTKFDPEWILLDLS